MKEWTIDEFIAECEYLCWHPYLYNESRMPSGICNGHEVGLYPRSWHSIVIDGGVCNLGHYTEDHPNGFDVYVVDGLKLSPLEYVRYKLNK